MYIPSDPPIDPSEVKAGGVPKGLTKAEFKIRKERDMRVAKKKIKEGIEHWEEVFRGKTGRPYFYVGEIKREEGWLEKLPGRTLCKAAQEARPKREEVEKQNKKRP